MKCIIGIVWILIILHTDILHANTVTSVDLQPPKNVEIEPFPVGETLTPTSVTIGWARVPDANNYIVSIFKTRNNEVVLHEEVKNVPTTTVQFKGLDPSTTYEVLVYSVKIHLNGNSIRSKEATRFNFTTRDSCTGNMIFVPCSYHCHPTCTNKSPACDRRCIAGCTCPIDKPYLHNNRCITSQECKESGAPPTEVLKRPSGLKFHKIKGSRDLLFTWDKVEGADYYRVIVTLPDGTVVQRHDKLEAEVVIIKNLKPRTRYRFKVRAVFIKELVSSRTLTTLPMLPPTISQVANTSFFAKWTTYPGATGFKMVIYDGATGDILQIFKNLADNFVTVQGLSPGTTYDVSMIVVTALSEIESAVTSVTTTGQTVQQDLLPSERDEIIYVIEETTTTTTAAPTTTTEPYVPTCEEIRLASQAFDQSNSGSSLQCSADGNYEPTQCEPSGCYCVNTRTGKKLDGSEYKSPTSIYAIACDKYGQLNIPPLAVTARALDTVTVRVRWAKIKEAAFYIAKVFHGFEGTFIKSISKLTRHYVDIGGLEKGTPYVVIVVAVNANGWTSTENVAGQFVATPYLDPPTNVRLEQYTIDSMRVSWRREGTALSYDVVVYETGKLQPTKYANVTNDYVIFQVHGIDAYTVKIISKGATTIPGTGTTVVVESLPASVSRAPTCLFPALDVIFVIDISNKMTLTQYNVAKTLYQKLIMGLTPMAKSPDDVTYTRFASVKTYGVSRTMFDFNRFTEPSNTWGAVRFVRQTSSSNFNVDNMVQTVYKQFFQRRSGSRRNVQTAVISFIGDLATVRHPTFDMKTRLLRASTNYITVAVDPSFTHDLGNANKVFIPSYQDIQMGYDFVMKRLCNLK